jgi:acyl carrier protein
MTRAEIYQRVSGFIIEHFELEPDRVKPDTKFFEDLGLDSIDAVELVIDLEELTGARIEESDLRSIVTIDDIVDVVVRRGSAGK